MLTKTAQHLDPLQKVAILVSTLDHRAADTLLDHLPADQASRVRDALMQLDEIPGELLQSVLREFMANGRAAAGGNHLDAASDVDAVELEPSLAEKLAASETYTELARTPPVATGSRPFRFLQEASAAVLVKHLRHENPQVIAIVVAHLRPSLAADVIAQLESRLQADVLRRVAELGSADPDTVQEVERHLHMLLSDEIQAAKSRAMGVSTVSSIINAAGRRSSQLASNLRRHDQELSSLLTSDAALPPKSPTANASPTAAEAPDRQSENERTRASTPGKTPGPATAREAAVAFDDLYRLSDAALAKIFHAAEDQLTLLALAGAAPPFVSRLLTQLPAREASRLRQRMEQLGPLRLTDVEQAQARLADLASRLAARGDIELPGAERFAAAV